MKLFGICFIVELVFVYRWKFTTILDELFVYYAIKMQTVYKYTQRSARFTNCPAPVEQNLSLPLLANDPLNRMLLPGHDDLLSSYPKIAFHLEQDRRRCTVSRNSSLAPEVL